MIGFAGLTHLGLNSAVAAAAKGFQTVGYQCAEVLVAQLERNEPHVSEPDLPEIMAQHRQRLSFSADVRALAGCDIVYIALDVPTDDAGQSDLAPVTALIAEVAGAIRPDTTLVVLCQVPPGYTRTLVWPADQLYYQVETLVFGNAVERALHPERFIVGCADPDRSLPPALVAYLGAFDCPILPMRYESAELSKIAINTCLVASITTANTLAELCEHIGADWAEIAPALRLDKRIGPHAYLKPGLGIAGGNLERDLVTVLNLAAEHRTDGQVVEAWIGNSRHRREWAWEKLNELVLERRQDARIAILGLTYKENTSSLKNSSALALVRRLLDMPITTYDPAAGDIGYENVVRADSALAAVADADVLLVMTPWPEFQSLTAGQLAESMAGKVVIDPYKVLAGEELIGQGFDYASLGEPIRRP